MAFGNQPRALRIWLIPFSILLGVATSLFVLTFWIDAAGDGERFNLILHPNAASAESTLSNAAEVIAAVLGIAVTVVAIVVELAANRYTHRITELFTSEPINFIVMGFFVVTALQAIFVSNTFDLGGEHPFVPYTGVIVSTAMLALGLLLLLPYFAFVFDFLNPIHIVDRIRRHSIEVIEAPGRAGVAERQAEAVRGIEQLADVGLNAMEHKDKGVSMASVDALQAMALDYQAIRARLPAEWFRVEGELAHNPDFVSMSSAVLEAVTGRRIWFEMKILRKYQTLYNEALNKMRDINYLIAINSRNLAEAALDTKNEQLFELTLKFFNTYLRATINAKDVRTAYNILHQYRLLADRALLEGDGERSVEIARYFKYYGIVSFNAKLPFILETVAYDLCALNEHALDLGSPAAHALLRIFLEVDKESETEVQEASLRGVRKAQVKLATYYLCKGENELAREVFMDMEAERKERLASIRNELLGVQSPEFWEISDRGENFDYLDPTRKEKLIEFFSWFEGLRPMPARTSIPEDRVAGPMAGEAVTGTTRVRS